jgi:hypothetical protein
MSARTLAAFSTIRTEGAMLPSDILVRVASGDKSLGGLEESSYHLAPGEKIGEATNRAWNRLQAAWANFQSAREKLAGTDTGTSLTRERWLLPLFQLLDYGRLQAAKAEEIGGKSYAISHAWQQNPIHLVGCNVDLDRRIQAAAGGMRSSPHSLLQELLNRGDQNLWGIVSNGLRLRLLRDNLSLTRQAYVEFDLEAMMAGEAYPDFVLLWLLLHQSRFEAERPEQCQLEKWSQVARTEGVRVLDGLRDGVQHSIEHLGQGFLAHPANAVLREHLRSGALNKQDYYRQILRLVYRLLFLFVADDRDLLLTPTSDPAAQKRYRNFYATTRLRHLATTRAGSRHHDLYCGLKLVMEKLSKDGCPELALPALGSFLFSPRALPDLSACDISNLHLLEAIRSLAVTQTGQSRRVVDYKNLGAEELGSVYESLLELHPDLDAQAAGFELKVAAGSERKKTGSYYTPTSLISCLLDSALDPVLLEAAKQPEPEAAILKLKVVDPACGSGHFLIAAAHRIAKRLAAVRTGEEEPPPEAQRKAIRDVIGHCIYGVDVNPMAVELCKVSLWMEALEPGKPLSFLEHRIQPGNSLLGATPALLAQGIPDEAFTAIEGDDKEICKEFKRINKDERNKQMRLFAATTEPWLQLGNFAASLVNLDTVGDDSIEAVREKERMYEAAIRSGDYLDGRFWADAWCASFVWKKTRAFKYPITEEVFRRIERNPHACEPWMRREIERIADQYHLFHWHLAFPDAFRLPLMDGEPENAQAGWNGGFDLVIGNPPWERVAIQEKEWFAGKNGQIAAISNARVRRQRIADLSEEDPALLREYEDAVRQADGEGAFIRFSRKYPLAGRGDVNTYAIFTELASTIVASRGMVGVIIPDTVATNVSTSALFSSLVERQSLKSLYGFKNERFFFTGIEHYVTFALVTFAGGFHRFPEMEFCWLAWTIEEMLDPDRRLVVKPQDLAFLNPLTKACPVVRTQRDLSILKSLYAAPTDFEALDWKGFYIRLVHMSDHASAIRSTEYLSFDHDGCVTDETGRSYLSLYEAKLIHQFNHRYATFDSVSPKDTAAGKAANCSVEALRDPNFRVQPRYWVQKGLFQDLLAKYPDQHGWLLAYRDICRSTDERTCIATVLPLLPATVSLPCLGVNGTDQRPLLLANLSTFVLDYAARQKVAGPHLSYGILRQLPILPSSIYEGACHLLAGAAPAAWIRQRVLELTYTSSDLKSFARSCGYEGAPFVWDEKRRFLLRCELDALFLHLYGVCSADAAYILDTFTTVRGRDEKIHQHYRTKRVILEMYEAMADSARTGFAYQTRLSPPPAAVNVTHQTAIPPGQTLPPVQISIADLVALPDDAWTTPLGVAPENVALFALVDVLRLLGGESDPQKVRIAAILVRKPALAVAFMDDAQAKEWFRLVGREAQPLKGNVIQISQFQHGAADHPWADAISQLKGSGGLVAASDKWSAGDRLPLSSGQDWISGRASVAVQLLGAITPADAEQGVIAFIRSVEDGTARRAIS